LRRIGIIFLIALSIVVVSACEITSLRNAAVQSGKQVSETRLLLSTYCTVTIHGSDDYELLKQAFELIEELEALLSITIEGSDIYRINHAGGEAVSVDSRTLEVINAGITFGEISGGLFDITIGRLSRLWDFGNRQHVPDESEIASAKETVDYRQIIVGSHSVQLEHPKAKIDLGAIAKGYIANEVAEFLISQGITSALIDLGGDITTVGSRYNNTPWRIAIRNPFDNIGNWIGIIEITNASIAASGTYERRFEDNSVLYHHILDPSTGMPGRSDVVSATVVAESAMIAEGLSTIAILAGSGSVQEVFESTSGFIGAVLVLDSEEVQIFGDIVFD